MKAFMMVINNNKIIGQFYKLMLVIKLKRTFHTDLILKNVPKQKHKFSHENQKNNGYKV
jgi:hypothetical protein